MAETRKMLCFSTADRHRTCPYPRIVCMMASVGHTSALTLSRQCRRWIPPVPAWSKDESLWSLFRGRTSSESILSAAEIEESAIPTTYNTLGKHLSSARVISLRVYWLIARSLTRAAESLVRNIKNLHFKGINIEDRELLIDQVR
jgi:hypothetical protein